jgi:hypothetical protein
MEYIKLPKKQSEPMFLTSHTIKKEDTINGIQIIPYIDSKNPKIVEELIGNQKRAIVSCPKVIDYSTCILSKVIKEDGIIRDYNDLYYGIRIIKKTSDEYYQKCYDNHLKKLLKRQIMSNSAKCLVKGQDKNGKYIRLASPLILLSETNYNEENDNTFFDFLLLKDIFKFIVENENKGNFHYKYSKIPYGFYPHITNVFGGKTLATVQPLYRLIIFSLSEKHPNRNEIFINQKDLDTNILPEYLDQNSYIRGKYKREELYEDLIALNLQLHDVSEDKKIIKALEYDKKRKQMIIHFNEEYFTKKT